jgi:hypothetical protein
MRKVIICTSGVSSSSSVDNRALFFCLRVSARPIPRFETQDVLIVKVSMMIIVMMLIKMIVRMLTKMLAIMLMVSM